MPLNLEQHVQNVLQKVQAQGHRIEQSTAQAFTTVMDAASSEAQRAKSKIVSTAHNLPSAFHTVNNRIEQSAVQAYHATNQLFANEFKKGAHEVGKVTQNVINTVTGSISEFWHLLPPSVKLLLSILVLGAIALTLQGSKYGLKAAQTGFAYVKENPQVLLAL